MNCVKCTKEIPNDFQYCNFCGTKQELNNTVNEENSVTSDCNNFKISGDILVKYIGTEERIKLPTTIKTIAKEAFANNDILSEITIPESVTLIEEGAFKGCTQLYSVELLGQITKLYKSTFEGCTFLQNIELPVSITAIEEKAFSNCHKLIEITIPKNVTAVDVNSFEGWSNRQIIHLPNQFSKIIFKNGSDFRYY